MTAQPTGHYFELSTAPISLRERRDFWRDVALNRSEPDFPAEASGFSASLRGYAGLAAALRDGRSEPVTLRRTVRRCRMDAGDEILLSAEIGDEGGVYSVNGQDIVFRPGDVVITDMATPFASRLGRYRELNFRLPRAAVAAAIGGEPSRLAGHILPATPLVSLFVSQLRVLADALPSLDDVGREAGTSSAAELALAMLRIECHPRMHELEALHPSGMWQAADRFIETNLGDHELGPDMIARALRCSRAYLYRLFARRNLTVMGHVQEVRLQASHRMLNDPGNLLPIADIAHLCGFGDPSSFVRAFRRRFGCLPRDLRAASHRQ